jgi:two-component sensor histidine kinase
VKLEELINDHLKLTVRDDGIGLPDKFDIKNLSSMGLNLVEMLVSQLNGMLEISSHNGTMFEITFKKQYYKPRLKKKELAKFKSEIC